MAENKEVLDELTKLRRQLSGALVTLTKMMDALGGETEDDETMRQAAIQEEQLRRKRSRMFARRIDEEMG